MSSESSALALPHTVSDRHFLGYAGPYERDRVCIALDSLRGGSSAGRVPNRLLLCSRKLALLCECYGI